MEKLKKILKNQYLYWDICYMLCTIFSVYYYYMSKSLVLHSDDAYQGVYWYHLLKTGNKAIYRLNLSLFSLVSFICYQIKGISLDLPRMAYAIVYALLILAVMIISCPLDKKADYRSLGLTAYIMFGVSIEGVLIFQAHIDIIILAYAAYMVTDHILKAKSVRKTEFLLLLFFLTWGNLSIDFIFYLLAVIPLLIVLNGLFYRKKEKKIILIDGVIIGSILLRNVIECVKNYFLPMAVRKSDENTVAVIFNNLDGISQNLRNLNYSLLHMFNGFFWGENVLQFKTVLWFINCCILLFGCYLIIRNLYDFVMYIKTGKKIDFISTVISTSATLIFLSYIFKALSPDYTSWRYAIGIYSGIVVLIQRKLYLSDLFIKKGKQLLAGIIFFIFLLPFKVEKIPSEPARDVRDELAVFLRENDLVNGFGDLWQAFYMDAASEGQLHLLAVNYEEDKGFYESWSNLENWHHNDFNFIICDTTMPVRGITYETVTGEFGIPVRTLQFGQYEIYVFDYDISTCVVLGDDNLSELQFRLEKERSKRKNSVSYENCQMDEYGHYRMFPNSIYKEQEMYLEPGNYTLTIGGKNLGDIAVNMNPDLLTKSSVTKQSDRECSFKFTLDTVFDGSLFTLVNDSENDVMYHYFRLKVEEDG